MSSNIIFVIIALVAIIYIFKSVKVGNLPINESFFWLSGSIVMLGLAIYPKIIDSIAYQVGIDYSPSLLFIVCIIFLLLMNMRMSKKIAQQQEKIIILAQEVASINSKGSKDE